MAAVTTDIKQINYLHFSIINISPWECESYTIKWDANMHKQDSGKKGLHVVWNQWVWIKVNIEISNASNVIHIYTKSKVCKQGQQY